MQRVDSLITPPLQLIYGMRESSENAVRGRAGTNVYAPPHPADAVAFTPPRRGAWGLDLGGGGSRRRSLFDNGVARIYVPKGFDSNALTERAFFRLRFVLPVSVLGQYEREKAFRSGIWDSDRL